MKQAHDGHHGGHLSFRRTLEKVRRQAYWAGWRSDVKRFCRQCPSCNDNFETKLPRSAPLQPVTTEVSCRGVKLQPSGQVRVRVVSASGGSFEEQRYMNGDDAAGKFDQEAALMDAEATKSAASNAIQTASRCMALEKDSRTKPCFGFSRAIASHVVG